jgi:hypothetical protein
VIRRVLAVILPAAWLAAVIWYLAGWLAVLALGGAAAIAWLLWEAVTAPLAVEDEHGFRILDVHETPGPRLPNRWTDGDWAELDSLSPPPDIPAAPDEGPAR